MKSVRRLALALAISGLSATSVLAQYGGSTAYPSTGRYSAPALLPLPEASGPWTQNARSVHSPTTPEYVAPVANYVAQPASRPVVAARIPARASSSPANSYSDLSYTAMQEAVPPPAPSPNGPPTQVEPVPGAMMPNAYDAAASNGVWGGDSVGVWGGSGCSGGDCGCEIAPCCTTWYGYVGGLVMTRDHSNKFWTTFETGNNPNQLMHFPGADSGPGGEVTIGYSWCGGFNDACGCTDGCNSCSMPYRHGIEFTYWGVTGLDASSSIRSETDQLSTPLDLGFVDIVAPGSPAGLFFDNAREHRVSRDDEIHNVEINFVDFSSPMSGRDVQFQWLVGARFFKFDEFLQFASVSGGNEFGNNGGLAEAYLDLDTENNLIGAQIGGRADWRVGCHWRVFAGTKVGVFANDINFDTRLYRGDGALATFSTTGNAFDLHAHKTDVSMLGQIDLGVAWDFSRHWSANVGYRAVGITGLALADDQIPAFLAAENDWTDIDSNGSMILHGGFAGLEFHY